MTRFWKTPALGLALAWLVVAPQQGAAQDTFVAPQGGWSEFRRLTLGGQVGQRLVGGLEVMVEGLVFFPEQAESTTARVFVSRSAWQANTALLYAFDRTRRAIPYVGVGASYAKNSRTVVVDGVRARLAVTGWTPTAIIGLRVPRGGVTPFVEWRNELRRDNQWVVVGGVRLQAPGI